MIQVYTRGYFCVCAVTKLPFVMAADEEGDASSGKRLNDPWTPLPQNIRIPQAPVDPRSELISSDQYIDSLERKLKKLKGKDDREPSSKDIIKSLGKLREDQMQRFLAQTSSGTTGVVPIIDSGDAASGSYLHRRLYPECQALNEEELLYLLHDDAVSKKAEEENSDEGVVPVVQTVPSGHPEGRSSLESRDQSGCAGAAGTDLP